MSINISDAFTKIGKIGGPLIGADYYRAGLTTKYGDIVGAYSTDKDLLDGLYSNLTIAQSLPQSTCEYVQALAQAAMIRIVNNDVPSNGLTLSQAMSIFISQMISSSNTVTRNNVTITPTTGGTNVGNPTFLSTLKRHDGLNSEYAFAETIKLKVTADSYSGGTSAGSEIVSVMGLPGVGNLDPGWPKGSGANLSMTLVDPANDAEGGYLQYLTNGTMEAFSTPNTPDNWPILVGSAGTSILKVTATTFDGAACLGFVGDGSVLHSVNQPFASSGTGTASTLVPLTTYGVSLWIRVATVPAAGVLTVDLFNGTSTVNDAQGTANSFTKTLSTLTANTWTNVNGVFRTPSAPTNNYALRIRCSTAVSSGTTLLIDRVAMTALRPAYLGGPMFSLIAGPTPAFLADNWQAVITNDRDGDLQTVFDRLFNMRNLGYQLPSASSGTSTLLDSALPPP